MEVVQLSAAPISLSQLQTFLPVSASDNFIDFNRACFQLNAIEPPIRPKPITAIFVILYDSLLTEASFNSSKNLFVLLLSRLLLDPFRQIVRVHLADNNALL